MIWFMVVGLPQCDSPTATPKAILPLLEKRLSLLRVERAAQTGLRHPDNPKTRKPSIIRSPL